MKMFSLQSEYRIPSAISVLPCLSVMDMVDSILETPKATITRLVTLLGNGSAPSSPATLGESLSVERAIVDKAPGDHSTGAQHLMH
jgi:hypothetical protein